MQLLVDCFLGLLQEELKSLDKRSVGIGGHGANAIHLAVGVGPLTMFGDLARGFQLRQVAAAAQRLNATLASESSFVSPGPDEGHRRPERGIRI